jgi:hypothetical protein
LLAGGAEGLEAASETTLRTCICLPRGDDVDAGCSELFVLVHVEVTAADVQRSIGCDRTESLELGKRALPTSAQRHR